MAKTQVSITYGGKQLDCELSYTMPYQSSYHKYNPRDCDSTLEGVAVVCPIHVYSSNKSITHAEPITSLIENTPIWECIEEIAINTIMERGYV